MPVAYSDRQGVEGARGMLWTFVYRHPLPAVLGAAALMITGAGYLRDAYDFWTAGLQPWQLQLTGFLLLFIAVTWMLVRWDAEHHDRAPQPVQWPWRRKIPVVDPREIFGHAPEPEERMREPTNEEIIYRQELRRFVIMIDSAFRELNGVASWLLPHPHPEHDFPSAASERIDRLASGLRYCFARIVEPCGLRMEDLRECERSLDANSRNGYRIAEANKLLELETIGFLRGAYCDLQDHIRTYRSATGINMQGIFDEWLTTERTCIDQLKTLKASPAASDRMQAFADDVFGVIGARHLRQAR